MQHYMLLPVTVSKLRSLDTILNLLNIKYHQTPLIKLCWRWKLWKKGVGAYTSSEIWYSIIEFKIQISFSGIISICQLNLTLVFGLNMVYNLPKHSVYLTLTLCLTTLANWHSFIIRWNKFIMETLIFICHYIKINSSFQLNFEGKRGLNFL